MAGTAAVAPGAPGTATGSASRAPSAGIGLDVALHALMIGVMIVTMVIDRSSAASLGGAAVLVVASIAAAPLARRRIGVWNHVVDLWVMVGLLLVMAGAASVGAVGGPHEHSLSGLGVGPVVASVAVVLAWLGARLGLRRLGRTPLWSFVVTAISVGVMLVACWL